MVSHARVSQASSLLDRLGSSVPLVAVELRPPRSDLPRSKSIDAWIDLHQAISELSRGDTAVFLTDSAVGSAEEDTLHHVAINLSGGVNLSRVVPFLTCKHSLEYCRRFAHHSTSIGVEALVVLGGDTSVGAPRCVEHAYELRQITRQQVPSLVLGGWANPHRDPVRQVDYLSDTAFTADFYLTQVVSHHNLRAVERFLREIRRRKLPYPGLFGVFYYRSANPKTLKMLSRFLPVPAQEITKEFEAGASAEEICARSIRALRRLGVNHVYVCNLNLDGLQERRARLADAAGS